MSASQVQRQKTLDHIRHHLDRLVSGPARTSLAPVDARIQAFLDRYLCELGPSMAARLPLDTFVLDCAGLARELSLPHDANVFESDIVTAYRLKQGVLHNPKNDRRTTQGVFHVAEGGLAIPDDKIAVSKPVFARLLQEALRPPASLLKLPFTANDPKPYGTFVSLLMRPVVCPEVKGVLTEKSLEVRFFVPGNLVGNLDFVESIFGNGGDPYLPEHDAALDCEHWTGNTGCVILAPHLIHLRKKDLGLPHYDQATQRQRRDGQCWKDAGELYNGGGAFKVTARDASGIVVTVIADNYFGYCKKEVKTQIGFAANLYGLAEEEHSGAALSFASYDLGDNFALDPALARELNTFDDVLRLYGDHIEAHPEGYARDKHHPEVLYVPADAKFNLTEQRIHWRRGDKDVSIRLSANYRYVLPSGYKVHMKKQTGSYSWHLVGTNAEGVLCHKPCTVSGGGKSEISKSIVDAMIQGPVFVADLHKDLDAVDALLKKNYAGRFKTSRPEDKTSRPVLSSERSLGSVIKLFTESDDYTDTYNAWLRTIPDHVMEVLLTVKRLHDPSWGEDWKSHFSVDIVNGHLGHELKFNNQKLVANYLRVGRDTDGSWRIFRVRQDYTAAEKIQYGDDITVSVTLPADKLPGINHRYPHPSVKLIHNCESHLFQRPDDAIHRGYDKQAEQDIASSGTFLSNWEPLTVDKAQRIVEDAIHFDRYTPPMKDLLSSFLRDSDEQAFVVSSAHPRIVDGKPTKNPRYLQKRPDRLQPIKNYLADTGARLYRGIPQGQPVFFAVNAVLPGRRSNPPEPKNGVPALAVYNPIHYQELPELFMDFISSLTGKSPSTTGFGSEGALTKGPFNALLPIFDLNNALVSFILTGYHGFSSAAGYVGPKVMVEHDISLLVPEIWCRMRPDEQDPAYLKAHGYLEKIDDYDYKGRRIKASILGWRITQRFVNAFLGRVFSNPRIVFTPEMLAPERQDAELFAEGIENIVITMKRVAEHYFNDGGIEAACPPLQALLHIMRDGHYQGKGLEDPAFRSLFTREAVLASEWYAERLRTQQARDIALWQRHVATLKDFLASRPADEVVSRLGLARRYERAQAELARVSRPDHPAQLIGTIGADPAATRPHAGA